MSDVLFGQRQAPWASDHLGTSSDTIYHYGCYLCSMAMSAKRMGKDTDPRRLNQAFIRAGVFVQQELLPDAALARIYGDVRLTYSRTFGGPADLSQLQRAPGEEAWVMVDFDHNPADGIETHWIRVQAWDGRTLVIDDPWYGDRGDFVRHYGANLAQTIQKIVRVSGLSAAPAPAPTPPPKPRPYFMLQQEDHTMDRDIAPGETKSFPVYAGPLPNGQGGQVAVSDFFNLLIPANAAGASQVDLFLDHLDGTEITHTATPVNPGAQAYGDVASLGLSGSGTLQVWNKGKQTVTAVVHRELVS